MHKVIKSRNTLTPPRYSPKSPYDVGCQLDRLQLLHSQHAGLGRYHSHEPDQPHVGHRQSDQGQLFLAILIARLVAMQVSPTSAPEGSSERGTTNS